MSFINEPSIAKPLEKIIRFGEEKIGHKMMPARLLLWTPKAFVSSMVLEGLIEHKKGKISERLLKLIRMQVSLLIACPFCIDMNSAGFRQHDITESEIEAMQRKRHLKDVQSFTERERYTLYFVRGLVRTPIKHHPKVVAKMTELFDEKEFSTIVTTIAQVDYWTRVIQGYGIQPAGFLDSCDLDIFNRPFTDKKETPTDHNETIEDKKETPIDHNETIEDIKESLSNHVTDGKDKNTTTIQKVSLIGLGALGVMYSKHLSEVLPEGALRIIVDNERKQRYMREGIYCNGELCSFNYVTPDEDVGTSDLIIFSVKYNQLDEAIKAVSKHVGENTIIISVLNGIVSEQDIARAYGIQHMLYCVAQGMTVIKDKNMVNYVNKGLICFGELDELKNSSKVQSLMEFFDHVGLPYEVNNQMRTKLWSKLLANVGINQTVAYYNGTNRTIQEQGTPRNMMVGAMKEVIRVAACEGVYLTDDDIEYWLKIIDTLEPEGMPSMAQDKRSGRSTEVELFAGTIVRLGKYYHIEVPINTLFYHHFKSH